MKAFVVWVPKLEGQEKDVPVATRLVPDRRAKHFWDESGTAIKAFTAALELPEDAWDVYLLYGADARWGEEFPPKPEYWMHQLGSRGNPRVPGPFFDPVVFARWANELLRR